MSLKSLYIVTSFMLSVSAIFAVIIASLIIYDQEEVTNTATDIKEHLKVEVVTDSVQEYYSVFNKKGGWINISFLLLGIGLTALVVSLFGYFGVHQKTVFLLFTFIILNCTLLMLQSGALMVLKWRKNELLQFYYFSNFSEAINGFHHEVKKIMFVISLMWSTVSLVTCLVTVILRSRSKRKENELEISTVNV